MPDFAPLILAEELTRRFGDFIAVNQLHVAVHPGEVFGLLGANGAGGVDMVRQARRARGQIGYVAQRFSLYGDLTVLENLQLQAGLYGLTGPRKRDRLEEVLRLLNLGHRRQVMAGALPLGYKQRLGLAAALLHEPRVLFLDEPTSGVDPMARQRFWELIYHLADGGIGILVTTHYMDEALFCDRLALGRGAVLRPAGVDAGWSHCRRGNPGGPVTPTLACAPAGTGQSRRGGFRPIDAGLVGSA